MSRAGSGTGLAKTVSANNSPSGGGFGDTDKMSVVPKTSAQITNDISALNRDQKGVEASAFAKAHEGAEIPTPRLHLHKAP